MLEELSWLGVSKKGLICRNWLYDCRYKVCQLSDAMSGIKMLSHFLFAITSPKFNQRGFILHWWIIFSFSGWHLVTFFQVIFLVENPLFTKKFTGKRPFQFPLCKYIGIGKPKLLALLFREKGLKSFYTHIQINWQIFLRLIIKYYF